VLLENACRTGTRTPLAETAASLVLAALLTFAGFLAYHHAGGPIELVTVDLSDPGVPGARDAAVPTRIGMEVPRPGARGLLRRLVTEWSAFEGWSVQSINFTTGGGRDGLFPPALAAGVWVGLAALIHLGLARRRRQPPSGRCLTAIFLAGWAMLDLRWQVDLTRQLALTRRQYAGKSGDEKRLAAADRSLYLFAKTVKRRLDAAPSRVFLVSEDLFGDRYFRRVRTHYFLLPHNVSSLWTSVPEASQTRTGDYVLIMRPGVEVAFDSERRVLGAGSLPVELLLDGHEGLLFRVR